MPSPGGPFRLLLTAEARAAWESLEHTDRRKWKKINKALQFLQRNPAHPSLAAHKWDTLRGKAPGGGDVWTAYVENNTPGAWRIFFYYDRHEAGVIHVVSIEPHS